MFAGKKPDKSVNLFDPIISRVQKQPAATRVLDHFRRIVKKPPSVIELSSNEVLRASRTRITLNGLRCRADLVPVVAPHLRCTFASASRMYFPSTRLTAARFSRARASLYTFTADT
jgi:hypothetical protein